MESDGDGDIGHEPSTVEEAAEAEDQVNGELDDAAEEATGDRVGNDEELEDDDGDDDDDTPDQFVVEAILDHKFLPNAPEPFYKIKWEGFDSKKDQTWEPQANLFPAAKQLLADYHHKIGGAPQPGGPKKRKSTASLKDSTTPEPKRSKRGDSADDDDEGWTPKGSDWDKFVAAVETIEKDQATGKLYAYIAWEKGRKTKIGLDVCYKKLPQSMLKFYEAHL